MDAALAADSSMFELVGRARRPPETGPPKAVRRADVPEDDNRPPHSGADPLVRLAWTIQPTPPPEVTWRAQHGGQRAPVRGGGRGRRRRRRVRLLRGCILARRRPGRRVAPHAQPPHRRITPGEGLPRTGARRLPGPAPRHPGRPARAGVQPSRRAAAAEQHQSRGRRCRAPPGTSPPRSSPPAATASMTCSRTASRIQASTRARPGGGLRARPHDQLPRSPYERIDEGPQQPLDHMDAQRMLSATVRLADRLAAANGRSNRGMGPALFATGGAVACSPAWSRDGLGTGDAQLKATSE